MKKTYGTYVIKFITFLAFLLEEFANPLIYITSALVGGTINTVMSGRPFNSVVPYLVPVFVQSFSRASQNFINRLRDRLLELPTERDDPAFIMDPRGNITHSGGKTMALFQQHRIRFLADFIGEEDAGKILGQVIAPERESRIITVFSPITSCWYETRTKSYKHARETDVLVWMQDVSRRETLDRNLSAMHRFAGDTIASIPEVAKQGGIDEKLASLIIESGFKAVFIAKTIAGGDLRGRVYKSDGSQIEISELITVPYQSSAPVLESRKQSSVVLAEINQFPSRDAFENKFPFHPEVKEFLGFPIDNFANYHEEVFSIIAFNKELGVDQFDRVFMETVIDNTRAIRYLVDLAIENDEQFIQKVMGLCAASEHSDEITGKHIFRVNDYSRFLAQQLGKDAVFTETLGQVAALHDIGKVAIPELIKLERRYTGEERARMQMHTIYGAQIIKTMMKYSSRHDSRLEMAYNVALHHHQTWIGTGYPGIKENGRAIAPNSKDHQLYIKLKPLKNNEIPVEALITGLADSYDALRGKRQYKPGFTHEQTCELLAMDDRLKVSGTDRFGPEIWTVFEKHHNEFARIFDAKTD